jgi:hypothetical protein
MRVKKNRKKKKKKVFTNVYRTTADYVHYQNIIGILRIEVTYMLVTLTDSTEQDLH